MDPLKCGLGREIKAGDMVCIPAKVLEVKDSGPTGVNIVVETAVNQPGPNKRTSLSVNAKQVFRANDGDSLDFAVKVEDNVEKLVDGSTVSGQAKGR